MTNFTVSGTGSRPDDLTPLRGTWTIGIYTTSGVALDGDGSWRADVNAYDTNPDGSLTISLPETSDSFAYTAAFESRDRHVRLGPFPFELLGDKTWQDIIDLPGPIAVPGGGGGSGAAVPAATTTVQGKVELATTAEGVTGTDAARAMTPAAARAATMAYAVTLGQRLVIPINSNGTWPSLATKLAAAGGWTGGVDWDSLSYAGATQPPEMDEGHRWLERVS